MVEVSAALPFSAMGVSFRVCPTRGIQRGGGFGREGSPFHPPTQHQAPSQLQGPPPLEKGARLLKFGMRRPPPREVRVETWGSSRAALSGWGLGRTGPTAPLPFLSPSPQVFLSQCVAGISPAGPTGGNPRLPAYCAFELLLFGALGAPALISSLSCFSYPHPH